MKALLQRVSQARVDIGAETVGAIDQGLLILLGVSAEDTEQSMRKLIDKSLAYRVFSDASGKMNLSVRDIAGEVLLVSQFTLCANTDKGLRPSFGSAAVPELAEALYDAAVAYLREQLGSVQTGRFGADMQIQLINDGPVTFLLET